MPYCIKCGEEVSDYQFNNYNGKCPQCIRNAGELKKERGLEQLIWGIGGIVIGVILGIIFPIYYVLSIGIKIAYIGFVIGGIIAFIVGIFKTINGWKDWKEKDHCVSKSF